MVKTYNPKDLERRLGFFETIKARIMAARMRRRWRRDREFRERIKTAVTTGLENVKPNPRRPGCEK